jgi:Co/Zn/Cd efflux system component
MQPSVLAWAMAATLGLVIAEILGGLLGHSVALLNDAVHNLSDVPALGISWLAMRWAQKPENSKKTYGYRRAKCWRHLPMRFVWSCCRYGWVGNRSRGCVRL